MRIAAFVSTLAVWAAAVNALPSITRTGKYLYDASGNRFSIKGVAYQPQGALAADSAANAANGGFPEPSSFVDPLSSAANCTRDIPYLRQLGVNTVRVYSVNSSLNHDDCMNALDAAGIYVLLDVSLPLNGSIDRSSPAWTTNLLNEYTSTINAFIKYPNMLGYNIGNEVINLPANTNAAPYVKAAARDIKAYLRGIGSQALVGYAAVDGEANFRNTLAEYLTCGNDTVTVDLYGLNNYEWCGNQNVNSSGWAAITNGFSQLPVATYMSEYGCITNPPRVWNEVPALFSSPVSNVFSGGIAFSYFPTADNYGMVTFSADGRTVTVSDDFNRLAAYYNSTSTPTSPAKSSVTAGSINCPAQNASLIASTTLPPTPNEAVCNCVDQNAFSCRVRQATANSPNIVGSLTEYACSLLGSSNSGASCAPIAGNGTSGTYGQFEFCSPAIKLSYAFSAYYQFNPVASSCDFSGNASLSNTRPNTAQDASAAAQSCLAQLPAGGVSTPSPTTSLSVSATSRSASSSSAASGAATSRSAADTVLCNSVMGRFTLFVSLLGAVMGAWIVL